MSWSAFRRRRFLPTNGRRTSYFCADEPGDEDLQLRFSKEGRLQSWMKPRTWLCPWQADSRRKSAFAKGRTDAEIAEHYKKVMQDLGYWGERPTVKNLAPWRAAIEREKQAKRNARAEHN